MLTEHFLEFALCITAEVSSCYMFIWRVLHTTVNLIGMLVYCMNKILPLYGTKITRFEQYSNGMKEKTFVSFPFKKKTVHHVR